MFGENKRGHRKCDVVRAHRCGQGLGETHEGHPWQLEDWGARTAPRAAGTQEGRSLTQKAEAAGRSAGTAQRRSERPSRSLTLSLWTLSLSQLKRRLKAWETAYSWSTEHGGG